MNRDLLIGHFQERLRLHAYPASTEVDGNAQQTSGCSFRSFNADRQRDSNSHRLTRVRALKAVFRVGRYIIARLMERRKLSFDRYGQCMYSYRLNKRREGLLLTLI